MKNLLKRMNERLDYLESGQAALDGMEKDEIQYRSAEIMLAIIATQEEILKTINEKNNKQ